MYYFFFTYVTVVQSLQVNYAHLSLVAHERGSVAAVSGTCFCRCDSMWFILTLAWCYQGAPGRSIWCFSLFQFCYQCRCFNKLTLRLNSVPMNKYESLIQALTHDVELLPCVALC